MQTHLQFKLNHPHVVAENFGDEIVAIHLERGNYYSIEKGGVAIWTLATAGATLDEIITTITQADSSNLTAMEVRTTVQRFLQDLQQADLVVPDTTGNPVPSPLSALPYAWDTKQQTFAMPVLREYTDMQDLLLLDPIHDVDAAGWPHVQQAWTAMQPAAENLMASHAWLPVGIQISPGDGTMDRYKLVAHFGE